MTKPLMLIIVAATLSLSACNDKKAPSEQQTSTQNNVQNSTPDIAQERLDRGSKYWAENKLDLAEAEFRKAIEEHPESARAHARLAGLLLTQNKTTEAIPVYQDAITLDPQNPRLFAALSIAYLHQQKFSMAKTMADQALKLDPTMKPAKKLNQYIETKERIIEQAGKADANALIPGTVKPNDAMHSKSIPPHGELKDNLPSTGKAHTAPAQ
jgi:Tfp pilus assembly protein PilF